MSKLVKLKKGFDIKLVGKAEKKLVEFQPAKTFAIKPTDFIGLQRPKVTVNEGDTYLKFTTVEGGFESNATYTMGTAILNGKIFAQIPDFLKQ